MSVPNGQTSKGGHHAGIDEREESLNASQEDDRDGSRADAMTGDDEEDDYEDSQQQQQQQQVASSSSTDATSSPSRARPVKKLKPKTLGEVLQRLLQQLKKRDHYEFFAVPVEEAEVPGYHAFIKDPMDFSTMEQKLNEGNYSDVEAFRSDFLLITRNAQAFNPAEGPSSIIHNEAKRIETWGQKAITREGASVIEEDVGDLPTLDQTSNRPNGTTTTSSPSTLSMGKAGSRLSIKLKRGPGIEDASTARHTPVRSSALSREIKVEDDAEDEDGDQMENGVNGDDDEDDDEDDEDYDASDRARSSSLRENSVTVEAGDRNRHHQASPSTPGTGSRTSPEVFRRAVGRPKGSGQGTSKGTPKSQKNKGRSSAVSAILGLSNETDPDVRQVPAPISSTSGVVASAIKLSQQLDGSIDMNSLEPDERRALLRPAGLDVWPDVLTPFIESVQPLHPDLQAQAGTLARPPAQVVDGFAAAMLSEPASSSVTHTYDVTGQPSEKAMTPFAISSGWTFGDLPLVPLSWPNPGTGTAGGSMSSSTQTSTSQSDPSTPIRGLKGRDRDREREAAGASNLEDWTFPRAHMARLLNHSDVGMHSGILPAAWVAHIVSSKGGPSVSRLPPYHLAAGQTLQNALYEELAHLPSRILLGPRPGGSDAEASKTQAKQDLVSTIEASMACDWGDSETEIMQKGARGSDTIREAVFGGVTGECYARSIDEFVSGAMQMAEDREEDRALEIEAEDEEVERKRRASEEDEEGRKRAKRIKRSEALRLSSYFDIDGEIKDGGDYLGVGMIPFDVRREAGSGIKQDGAGGGQDDDDIKPLKNKRESSTPVSSRRSMSLFAERGFSQGRSSDVDGSVRNPMTARKAWTWDQCVIRGRVLDQPLREYVRDTVVSPLTGGLLGALVKARGPEPLQRSNIETLQGSIDGSNLDEALLEAVMKEFKEQVDSKYHLSTPTVAPTLTPQIIDSLTNPKTTRLGKQLAELVRGKQELIDLDSLLRGPQDLLPNQTIRQKGVAETLRTCAPLLAVEDAKYRDETRQMLIDLAKQAPSHELKKGQWLAWIQKQQTPGASQP